MEGADAAVLGCRARRALADAVERLAAAGVPEPAREARLLLRWAAGGLASAALPGEADQLPEPVAARFAEAVARRQAREPFAYVTGEREFFGLPFAVGPAVLVPRPETELLVSEALAFLGDRPAEVADMGTGSGCIAVALAVHAPAVRVWAVDISGAALEVCAANAARHGVAERVVPVAGDLWRAGLPPELEGRLDAVLSNPPYVTPEEWAGLDPEVRLYEPKRALVPEVADPYAPLAAGAWQWLRRGGLLACEVGAGRAAAVAETLRRIGFRAVRALPDLAGVPRMVRGERG
jgi:release factor glutamine methyltransferase